MTYTKKHIIFYAILYFFILFFSILSVLITIRMTPINHTRRKLLEEKQRLQSDNRRMSLQICEQTRLQLVEQVASENLKMRPGKMIIIPVDYD